MEKLRKFVAALLVALALLAAAPVSQALVPPAFADMPGENGN